jgi:hypothetical protein
MAGGIDADRVVETGRVRYHGECHCDSVAACSVCRAVKMGRWAGTLMCHMEALRDRGGSECLVTFTVPHRRETDLEGLHRVLRLAHRDTFSGAGWKAIAKRYGYLGSARVLETTWSPFAGHHPHIHSLCFFARRVEDLPALRLALVARFTAMLFKHAIREAFDLPVSNELVDRAVTVQQASHAGLYITKMGLAEELTSPNTKVGKEIQGVYHLTMPQLARRLAWARLRYGEDGPTARERDRRRYRSDLKVFLAYVSIMRGQQIFRVGQGLAAKINALPLRPDVVPELATMAGVPADELPPDVEPLYHFSPTDWGKFRAAGPLARVELERLAELERVPAAELRGFIDDVLGGRWRPRRDVLWGEDADSPLFDPTANADA